MIKAGAHKLFRTLGFDIVRARPQERLPVDFRNDEADIINQVRPWTMTSVERLYALIHAVRYISSNRIPGALVECGVWKGGSMAAIARTLLEKRDVERDLYLFDTFEGMPEPTSKDSDYSGKSASELMSKEPRFKCADAPLLEVKSVLYGTGYPREKMHFIPGRVEETIPAAAPDMIALLRLDTDWYESTRHELEHLFPRLSHKGVIIIDDYGHWNGSRQACDEYFAGTGIPILLNRIDYTGRIAVKL